VSSCGLSTGVSSGGMYEAFPLFPFPCHGGYSPPFHIMRLHHMLLACVAVDQASAHERHAYTTWQVNMGLVLFTLDPVGVQGP
jgi:hypothetical protein